MPVESLAKQDSPVKDFVAEACFCQKTWLVAFLFAFTMSGVMMVVLTVITTIEDGWSLLFCCCFNGCFVVVSFLIQW